MKNAADAAAYLEKMGFDLSDLDGEKAMSEIDAAYLFPQQTAALGMLRALDAYDPARCPNLDAYLVRQLDQVLLRMLPPSKRYGVPYAPRKKGFRVDSLDAIGLAKAVPVKVRKGKGKPFQMVRRLRCWLAGKEAVPCAKSAV